MIDGKYGLGATTGATIGMFPSRRSSRPRSGKKRRLLGEHLFGYLVFPTSAAVRRQIVDRYVQVFTDVRFLVENDDTPAETLLILGAQLFGPSEGPAGA